MKTNLKKIFNLYNLAVLICIVVIIISAYIIFKPQKNVTPWGQQVVTSGINENEQITEEKAKELAIKQFKNMGEKNVKKDTLDVLKIQRNKEEYYYISSADNTLEIKIKGGIVTKLNSASVK